MSDGQGELPYEDHEGEATAGWSGSDASHERASDEAVSGAASARQRKVIALLLGAGARGLTWHEIADRTGQHHGQVTGALSVLHKTNHIARLRQKRAGSSVYVHLSFVNDRPVAPFKPNSRISIPTLAVPTLAEEHAIEFVLKRREIGYAIVCIPQEIIDDLMRFVKRAGG